VKARSVREKKYELKNETNSQHIPSKGNNKLVYAAKLVLGQTKHGGSPI